MNIYSLSKSNNTLTGVFLCRSLTVMIGVEMLTISYHLFFENQR